MGRGWAAGAWGQQDKEAKPATRYGIVADLDTYPQNTPKAALDSAIKAIDRGEKATFGEFARDGQVFRLQRQPA